MKYSYWLWPALLLFSALVTWIVYALLPGDALRIFVVSWFFIICPGMALVRLLRLRNVLAEYTLAVAASLTLDTMVASLQLYAHRWSPTVTLIILIGICVIGALLQLFFLRPTSEPVRRPVIVS